MAEQYRPWYCSALTGNSLRSNVCGVREVIAKQVIGSGGRKRTVSVCEFGCWHGSYGQAIKCKNAIAFISKPENKQLPREGAAR